ncbi:putative aminopeptidase W07G4.4 [Uloborus diversus]|uniref:putative aminopeptidase W07G4.4 n=1 Tax=Uloborus diversus TaxID=327109 RepID=UPI00240A8A8F|nr:putative aminopeptidase W07G4.4 [Uloborus diversus]
MPSEVMLPYHFWSENPVLIENITEKFDSLVIVASDVTKILSTGFLPEFLNELIIHKENDAAFDNVETFLVPRVAKHKNISKLVYSPTGPLNRDYDDVRRYADAACKGLKRILKAGAKSPILVIADPSLQKFKFIELVSLLGAAEAIYVPLEIREDVPSRAQKVDVLGFCSAADGSHSSEALKLVSAIERGRVLCRDIGGSDPERMAAPNVANYVQELFENTCINVEVIESETKLAKEYPLLFAVNRAAKGIERHRARLIYLTYEPEEYDTTLVLVGKGITYDTGGADIKAGGVMAGMHRDKCGAAAVAGFFQTLSILKPKRIKVLGGMAMVRNSVGADCYVSDEIITSRAGLRVRIGNTDAEGRMVMADVLCHMKEKVLREKNPHLFTIATLTGHACLAAGDGYSIIMENGPAKNGNVGSSIQEAGEDFGDMFEVSSIRREDYEFHKGKSEYEDVLQANNAPSSRTARGHQGPAAFLIMASGLDKHGNDSGEPLKYCHIDIAPSSGPFPGIPSGAPIPALTRRFLLK